MPAHDYLFKLCRRGISAFSSGAPLVYKVLRRFSSVVARPLPDSSSARSHLEELSPKPVHSMPGGVYRHPATVDVSVIVPAYNAECYIDDCLDSILSQEGDFSMEVVVVNDGSTDGTRERVLSHASSDSRLRLIDQENRGFSGARNTGISEARGNTLAFVDSDDMLARGHLATLMSDFSRGGRLRKRVLVEDVTWRRDSR